MRRLLFVLGIVVLLVAANMAEVKAADIPTHEVCKGYEEKVEHLALWFNGDPTPTPRPTQPTSTPRPTPEFPSGSLRNPISFCQGAIWWWQDGRTVELWFKEYYRGSEAEAKMDKNAFMKPELDPGNEVLAVYGHLWYFDSPKTASDEKLTSSTAFVRSISKGKEYKFMAQATKPNFEATLYPNGETEGWVLFQVSKTDKNPLFGIALADKDYRLTIELLFSLKIEAAPVK